MAFPQNRPKFSSSEHSLKVLSSKSIEEAKFTSTLEHSIQKDANSPNVSSINLTREPSSSHIDLVNNENTDSYENLTLVSEGKENQSSECSVALEQPTEDFIGENYDKYFMESGVLNQIELRGPIWKNYKPINNNALYANILKDPFNAQTIVMEFLLSYNADSELAIKKLIRFCVDLAGYQNFDPTNHFDVNDSEQSSKRIINLMESEQILSKNPLLVNTGKYLLMERNTRLVKNLKMAIYNFLQKLIFSAHEKYVMYDEKLMTCFLWFVKHMTQSQAKPIRHTGAVIGVKALTAIILVLNNVINEINYSVGSSATEGFNLQQQKAKLTNLIENFYLIFSNNCHLQDSAVAMMRVECIYESKIWLKYFPKFFISDLSTMHYIIKLIDDPSKEVRYAALQAFEHLLEIPEMFKFFNANFIDQLTSYASKRFYDVNVDVSVKAIEVIEYLLLIDRTLIKNSILQNIVNLIFDQYAPIGKAACKFYLSYFATYNITSEQILVAIAAILSKMKNFNNPKELIVEGFLYPCQQMQNWPLFCELISNERIDMPMRELLAEIFAEAVTQRLTGKPGVERTLSQTVIDIDTETYEQTAEVLGNLNTILMEQNNPKILEDILKIIIVVNSFRLDKNLSMEYSEISNTIKMLFADRTETGLLKKIAEVMRYLCDIVDFAERGRNLAKIICSENINGLQKCLREQTGEGYKYAQKVVILYELFDLNAQLSYDNLTEPLTNVDEQTSSCLLESCKWHLTWNMRNLTGSSRANQQKQFNQEIAGLSNKCKLFIDLCCKSMKSFVNEKYIVEVFATLCDLCTTFTKELKTPIKLNMTHKNLVMKIADKEVHKLLTDVLDKFIIYSKILTLSERRTNVVRYINLVHNAILPTSMLSNVFKYYCVFNNDYGPIILSSLTSISVWEDPNKIYIIVLHTMQSIYESIFKKYGAVDTRSEEGIQLELLAKQFAAFKFFHGSKQLFKMMCFIFKYAFADKANLNFLYIGKIFLDSVSKKEDYENILHIFKNKITSEYEKNDAVLYFSIGLNKVATKISRKRVQVSPTREQKKPTQKT